MKEMEEVRVFARPGIILIRTDSDYPDKDATDLLQVVYELVESFQEVAQACQFHQVATSVLPTLLDQQHATMLKHVNKAPP